MFICYLVTVTVYVFPVYRAVFAHSTSLKQTNNLDSGIVAEPLSGSRVIAPISFTNEPAWGSTGKHCCLVIRPGYAVVLRSLEGVQSDPPVLRKVQ